MTLRSIVVLSLGLIASLVLAACSGPGTKATFHSQADPQMLSAWGIFDISSGGLELSNRVVPYDLNTPLFTDYAHKLRTIWIPEEAGGADFRRSDYPDFPVGTVISKTFYYPLEDTGSGAVLKFEDPSGKLNPALESLEDIRLMETRLLVRRDQGWQAVSYVWNEDQTDAILTKIGDAQKLTLADKQGTEQDFTYIVPDINQCSGCHAPNNTTREMVPLGVRPRHLNKAYEHDGQHVNQLVYLQAAGYLERMEPTETIAKNADWMDTSLPLDMRARSYLDINCSHCHNPVGPADTSGLDLMMEAEIGPALGICKLPIAAGSGTGGRTFSIVPGQPDASIMLYRLETTKPGAMMPELGRSLYHAEGAELIRRWITEMQGGCED